LLATHDGHATVGPCPDKAWVVAAPAHGVVARPVRATHDYRKLRHGAVRNRVDHGRASFDDALLLIFAAHHKSGDVVQIEQRRARLIAKLNKLGGFVGAFGKEHAVVGEDANRVAIDMGVTTDERGLAGMTPSNSSGSYLGGSGVCRRCCVASGLLILSWLTIMRPIRMASASSSAM